MPTYDSYRLPPFILNGNRVLSLQALEDEGVPESVFWALRPDGSVWLDWKSVYQLIAFDPEERTLFDANFRDGVGRTSLAKHLRWTIKRAQRVYARVRRRIHKLRRAAPSEGCLTSHVRLATDATRTMELIRLYGGGLVWQLKHERE